MTHAFKVGMEVFIDRNCFGSRDPMQLCTVERVTATQFTAGGMRFKADGDTGWQIGGWNRVSCRIATDEMKRKNELTIKHRNAENALGEIAKAIERMRDDEAVMWFDMLPQAAKDKLQEVTK